MYTDWVLLSSGGQVLGDGGERTQYQLIYGASNGKKGKMSWGLCGGMVDSLLVCSSLLCSAKQGLEICTAAPS